MKGTTVMGSIVAPAALGQGMKYRIAFVTDGVTDALHSDHQYYDSFVQAEADVHGLGKNPEPVTWLALISSMDGTKATNRLPVDNVPIYLLSADQVATGSTSLWNGSLLHAIDQSPTTTGITGEVWTGTRADGDVSYPLGSTGYHVQCAGFTIRLPDMFGAGFVTQPNVQKRLVAISEVFAVG
jgi:hypothetical protein